MLLVFAEGLPGQMSHASSPAGWSEAGPRPVPGMTHCTACKSLLTIPRCSFLVSRAMWSVLEALPVDRQEATCEQLYDTGS